MINNLQVWWIPQIPGKQFHVDVADIKEAKKILSVLAKYDIFQMENNIKGDFCNAGGLQEFDGEDWIDWDKDGYGIDEVDENGNPE